MSITLNVNSDNTVYKIIELARPPLGCFKPELILYNWQTIHNLLNDTLKDSLSIVETSTIIKYIVQNCHYSLHIPGLAQILSEIAFKLGAVKLYNEVFKLFEIQKLGYLKYSDDYKLSLENNQNCFLQDTIKQNKKVDLISNLQAEFINCENNLGTNEDIFIEHNIERILSKSLEAFTTSDIKINSECSSNINSNEFISKRNSIEVNILNNQLQFLATDTSYGNIKVLYNLPDKGISEDILSSEIIKKDTCKFDTNEKLIRYLNSVQPKLHIKVPSFEPCIHTLDRLLSGQSLIGELPNTKASKLFHNMNRYSRFDTEHTCNLKDISCGTMSEQVYDMINNIYTKPNKQFDKKRLYYFSLTKIDRLDDQKYIYIQDKCGNFWRTRKSISKLVWKKCSDMKEINMILKHSRQIKKDTYNSKTLQNIFDIDQLECAKNKENPILVKVPSMVDISDSKSYYSNILYPKSMKYSNNITYSLFTKINENVTIKSSNISEIYVTIKKSSTCNQHCNYIIKPLMSLAVFIQLPGKPKFTQSLKIILEHIFSEAYSHITELYILFFLCTRSHLKPFHILEKNLQLIDYNSDYILFLFDQLFSSQTETNKLIILLIWSSVICYSELPNEIYSKTFRKSYQYYTRQIIKMINKKLTKTVNSSNTSDLINWRDKALYSLRLTPKRNLINACHLWCKLFLQLSTYDKALLQSFVIIKLTVAILIELDIPEISTSVISLCKILQHDAELT